MKNIHILCRPCVTRSFDQIYLYNFLDQLNGGELIVIHLMVGLSLDDSKVQWNSLKMAPLEVFETLTEDSTGS